MTRLALCVAVSLVGCGRPEAEAFELEPDARVVVPEPEPTTTELRTFDGAFDVALGDLNRDGLLDVVIPGRSVLQVIYGRGVREFETASIPFSEEPTAIALGDLDGDGWTDVVVTHNYGNHVSFLRGSSRGLELTMQRETGRGPTSALIADVDADGQLDVLVGNGSDDVVTLLRGPDFLPVAIDGFKQPGTPALADVDGDGDLDLCAQTTSGVIVRENLGAGQFASARRIALGRSFGSMVSANLDGEGGADLAAVTWGDGPISLVLHGAMGERTRDFIVGEGPRDVEPADVDRDGLTDLVVADRAGQVHVLFNDGHAGFERRLSIATGDQPLRVAAGDLDGDGAIEIVSVDLNRALVFWGTPGSTPVGASTCAPRGSACESGLPCCSLLGCRSGQCL